MKNILYASLFIFLLIPAQNLLAQETRYLRSPDRAREASDKTWFVAAATNKEARQLDIPLNFLNSGKFEFNILQDGHNAHYLTNQEVFKVEKKILKSKDRVHVKLAPGGGACILIKAL